MDKQTFLDQITEIGKQEDAAQMRTMLSELTDQVADVFDEVGKLTEQNQSYAQDNENLRSANMKLFLQVGEQRGEGNPAPGIDPPKPQKMSFDDLFDERGNIL